MISRAVSVAVPQTNPARPALPRINTDLSPKIGEDVVQYYRTGVFADPKVQKTFLQQAELHTDGHKRLITALREECQALYAAGKHAKQRAIRAEERSIRAQMDAADARQQMYSQAAALDVLKGELEEANRSMGEMDALMTQSRTKRLHRMSQIINDDASHVMRREDETRGEGVGAAK